MDILAESDRLHARIQRLVDEPPARATFEELALDIFRFQERYQDGMHRMATAYGPVRSYEDIVAVPAEVFRWARVAVHPRSLDTARFETSGTSGAEPGLHAMRRLDTYRKLSVGFARSAFGSVLNRHPRVMALAPEPRQPNTSSLGAMMRFFMEEFDGEGEIWLIDEAGIALGRLEAELARAREQDRPVLLLATSFALVALLDSLDERRLVCPRGSLVMQTGGFKGRTREVPRERLRQQLAQAFEIPVEAVIGEYGMTELTSQLYEATAPGGLLVAAPGVYVEPPWLEITPVDPLTLSRVPDGEVGLARIIDLGNVDSCVAVLTEDRVRRTKGGVQVLGRRTGARPRGCSLPFETLVQRRSNAP